MGSMAVIDGKDQRKKGLIDKNMKGGDIPVERFLFGRPQNIFCLFLNAKSTEPILSGWLIYVAFRRTILSIFCCAVCSQLSHSWGRDIFGQHGREPLADLVTD